MRRFKSNSNRNSQVPQSPPTSYTTPMANGHTNTNPLFAGPATTAIGGGVGAAGGAGDSRPISVSTNQSFDFAGRPVSQVQAIAIPNNAPTSSAAATSSALSRTDLIVLKHFWESKAEDNAGRDLHFLKFPSFPNSPEHKDLLPFCEIYHLIKTQSGAKIMSLGTGSVDGVYIGFELFTGSQLHIDIDPNWNQTITHYRVSFRPIERFLNDPNTESITGSWQKPVTIEFLEEMWKNRWENDLMGLCWEAREVRELSPTSAAGDGTD